MSGSLSIFGSSCRTLVLRLVLPFVVAAGLIVSFNIYLEHLGFKPRLNCWGKCDDDYNEIYTRAVRAKEDGKRVIAFIGDSRIEWGLDADEVQRVLEENGEKNVEVFNLAIPGRNVRTMLTRLNEAKFFPDTLVIGYSHLSFYWSKNYVEQQPRRLSWMESDLARLRSFAQREILMWPFSPAEIWYYVSHGSAPTTDGTSWLDATEISPRGQARVHYRLSSDEAEGLQKKAYEDMYKVTMTDQMIADINQSFLRDISIQKASGTKVLLLKMPLSDWALSLEAANERTGLTQLASYLQTPFVDGNLSPGASKLVTFDGLHLTPPSAIVFASWLAKSFILPNLR